MNAIAGGRNAKGIVRRHRNVSDGAVHTRGTGPSGMQAETTARRAFGVALGFLAVTAALGAVLRLQGVWSVPGMNYGHLLHTHSHVAFLGWVLNAYFALALVYFTPASERRTFLRIFFVLQVAMIGMMVSYPFQGYGPVSISFSTLHTISSVLFAWRLWRHNEAAPAARGHLQVALVFLIASGAGPLVLGPLAAAGMRDTPAYSLAIYFYLHAQYNGWFLFFLQAVLLQSLARHGLRTDEPAARRALLWLATGTVLTYAQSTLWLGPPAWVRTVAGVGGVVQLVGCYHLLRAVREAGVLFAGSARWLAALTLGAFLLKHALQAASAWPGLDAWVNQRLTVIAFLHLVFLGVVTPAILAAALRLGWLRDGLTTRIGLIVLIGTALLTEGLLISGPLLGYYSASLLFGAALGMTFGAVVLLISFVASAPATSV